ncbi:KinB-signaling pathway activation protein [Lottiidibacillus patelloidae]|uniref:KinB-signaling pathway activation protein n=1 Tax=Lottiidibacillus patelloidae TaxID=2670334 RepID=A0A263BQU5_9BACI|nr:KinB-signaling pathway activation protein [Lottiidibacillus patelloidae]OZM55952.1 KinB-signaling pathway activation protein [Lottiidibacillus patelloidae]
MKIKNWIYLFYTTLLLGGMVGVFTGVIIEREQYINFLREGLALDILFSVFWLFGISLIFSLISQMGFFAYLTVHRFGLGMFGALWNPVQWLLIAVVYFDLIWLRYINFAEGEGILPYILTASFLLVVGLVVAYVKSKATNKGAFVPTLFFIVVVTTLEWFPVLRINDAKYLWLMLLPLLACNIWQVLILHRLTGTTK